MNGQKVWTSSAQHAEDFGILVTRTDPDLPKHEGLTFFIVDMRSPGIEVRPLIQAQGVAHFNEVFLSDVRIPAEHVVGAVGGGWKVTRTTLKSEELDDLGSRPGLRLLGGAVHLPSGSDAPRTRSCVRTWRGCGPTSRSSSGWVGARRRRS